MRLVFLFALLLAGCDSLVPGDYGDYGGFEATVSGALDLDLHGTAQVYQYPDTSFAELYLDITNDFARYIALTTADTVALAGRPLRPRRRVPQRHRVPGRQPHGADVRRRSREP